MKKFLYTLAFTLALTACVEEQLAPDGPGVTGKEQFSPCRDSVAVFGICTGLSSQGHGTKAMVEGADIKNLYVAVFDKAGFKLSEYVKAEHVETGSELYNDTPYDYTVSLKVSDKPRILHIIANAPEEIRFGSENEVIGELVTKYDGDDTQEGGFKNAYWQRLEFDNITAKPQEGEEDYTAKLAAYNKVYDALRSVKLIRNYSKVTVKSGCENFILNGFWFENYPLEGTIAPYNRNTQEFVANYQDYLTIKSVESPEDSVFTFSNGRTVNGANYQGFMLASTGFETGEGVLDSEKDNWHGVISVDDELVSTGYVYEREKALVKPQYIIVAGYYGTEKSTIDRDNLRYYKIAMQDADGQFYAMLRNFDYMVKITEVTTAGCATPEAAINSIPSGDISVNVEYNELPNISDGEARMSVDHTTVVVIAPIGQTTTAEILYKYEPNINSNAYTGLGNEFLTEDNPEHGRPFVLMDWEGTSGSNGDVIGNLVVSSTYVDGDEVKHLKTTDMSDSDNPTDVSPYAGADDGFGHIVITTTEVTATPKTQSITITGVRYEDNARKTITRTVNLILRPSLELSLSAGPNTNYEVASDNADYASANIPTGSGEKVTLNLSFDAYLPSSMFPMDFKIETTNRTLSPDDEYNAVQELPVRNGIGSDGYPSYWFEKTLTWDEYSAARTVDGNKTFPVYFKTIVPTSATTFKVSQAAFNNASVKVNNASLRSFNNLAFSASSHEVGVSERFSFDLSTSTNLPASITVKMSGIEPSPVQTSGSTALTYVKSEGGYDYYTMVPSEGVTHYQFDVTPFVEDIVTVSLSAFLYTDNSKTILAGAGAVRIYTQDDFITITNTPAYEQGKMVPGEKAALKIWIPVICNEDNKAVTIGGLSTTRSTTTTIIDGLECRSYTTSAGAYSAPVNSAGGNIGYKATLAVQVGGNPAGSVKVPIYGIQLGEEMTSTSFDSGTRYILKAPDTDFNRYLYNPGTNNASAIFKRDSDFNNQFDNTFLMNINSGKISTVSSSTTYYLDFQQAKGGSWTNRTYSYTPRFDSTQNNTSITFAYSANNGISLAQTNDERKSDYGGSANYVTRYLYNNEDNITQNTSVHYWHIYPAVFVAPAE